MTVRRAILYFSPLIWVLLLFAVGRFSPDCPAGIDGIQCESEHWTWWPGLILFVLFWLNLVVVVVVAAVNGVRRFRVLSRTPVGQDPSDPRP